MKKVNVKDLQAGRLVRVTLKVAGFTHNGVILTHEQNLSFTINHNYIVIEPKELRNIDAELI